MYSSARQAYESGAKTATTSRQLEAAALFKAARQLEGCIGEWSAPDRKARLVEALRNNQRLWTVFQSELARPDQPLPLELRHNLMRLSAFVDRRTFEILSAPEPEKLRALIEINRNIASGLSESQA